MVFSLCLSCLNGVRVDETRRLHAFILPIYMYKYFFFHLEGEKGVNIYILSKVSVWITCELSAITSTYNISESP